MRFAGDPGADALRQTCGRMAKLGRVHMHLALTCCAGSRMWSVHRPDYQPMSGPDYGADFHLRVYDSGNPPAVSVSAGAQAHLDVTRAADSTSPGWTPQAIALILHGRQTHPATALAGRRLGIPTGSCGPSRRVREHVSAGRVVRRVSGVLGQGNWRAS